MKTKIFGMLTAFALSIILWSCNGSKSSGDAVDLKFNLEKGKSYEYTMKTHFDMDMEMMGKKMNTGGDMDFGFNMKVNDVDAQGNRMLSSTYDVIRFKMNAMGMDMGYDSKNVGDTTKENMMSGMFRKIFAGMLGKTFKMTMSQKGEISKIEGLQEMVQSMSDHLDIPENMKAQMQKQMQQSFSDDQIKQSFEQGFGFYPDKPVKVGDSWTKNMTRNMNNMSMNMDSKYSVKEVNEKTVVLDITGVIKAGGKDSSATAGMDMKGDSKGTMEIERSTGMAKKGTMDMTIKITAPGMSSPMNMKSTVIIEGKQQ